MSHFERISEDTGLSPVWRVCSGFIAAARRRQLPGKIIPP